MDWNNDGLQDLIVGDGVGNVHLYINSGTDTNPSLDNGTLVQANGIDIDVGNRAAPVMTDLYGGAQNLLVGNLDGNIQIYLNQGSSSAPSYRTYSLLQAGGSTFDIGARAAPRIYDWNGDGVKDILVGETEGYIYYLENVGTNNAPVFNAAEKLLLLNDDPLRYLTKIDNLNYLVPRSRFDIVDWNNDGYADIVVGGQDGRVMLFTATPEPVSSVLFVIGGGVFALSGLRKKIRKRNS